MDSEGNVSLMLKHMVDVADMALSNVRRVCLRILRSTNASRIHSFETVSTTLPRKIPLTLPVAWLE